MSLYQRSTQGQDWILSGASKYSSVLSIQSYFTELGIDYSVDAIVVLILVDVIGFGKP